MVIMFTINYVFTCRAGPLVRKQAKHQKKMFAYWPLDAAKSYTMDL